MTNQRKPREFWVRLKVESKWKDHWHSTPCVGTRNYWEDEHTIHVRELNSQGIDEETVRRIIEAMKEMNSGHKRDFYISELESKFLGVKE